jgi:hypothetical protein
MGGGREMEEGGWRGQASQMTGEGGRGVSDCDEGMIVRYVNRDALIP